MKIAIVALACLVACVSAGVHRDAPEHPSDKVGNLPKCNKSNVGSFHRHQHPLKYWECIKDRFFFPVYYPAQRDCPAWTFFSEKCEKCVRNPFTCDVKPEPEPEPEPEPTEETPIEEVTEEEPIEEVTEEEPVEEVTEPEPEPEVPEESSENSESSENGSDSSESGSDSSESGSNSSESGSSSSSESGSDSQETSPGSGETDPEVEPTDAPVDSGEVEPTDAPEVEPTNAPVDSGEVEPTDAPEVEPTDAPVDSGEVEPTAEPTQAPEPTPAPEDPSCEVKCVKPWDEPEYHADPESCGHFYQCSNGKPHQLACPAGLVFNPNANPGPVCDHKYNYQCTEKPGCPKPTPAPEPSCQKPVCSEHVDQEKGEYHPNPEDCSTFYHCAQAADFSWYPELQECPPGLEFNARLNVCDYPAEAKCTVTCPANKGIFF